jgi:hypothetical protein
MQVPGVMPLWCQVSIRQIRLLDAGGWAGIAAAGSLWV